MEAGLLKRGGEVVLRVLPSFPGMPSSLDAYIVAPGLVSAKSSEATVDAWSSSADTHRSTNPEDDSWAPTWWPLKKLPSLAASEGDESPVGASFPSRSYGTEDLGNGRQWERL